MQYGFSFRIRAIHLMNLFSRHPVTQIEGIVGSNHDVIGTDHAL